MVVLCHLAVSRRWKTYQLLIQMHCKIFYYKKYIWNKFAVKKKLEMILLYKYLPNLVALLYFCIVEITFHDILLFFYFESLQISSWMTTASMLLVTLFALIRFYGGPILQSCSRDKGEQYMTSPDAEKNGLPYSALPSVTSGLGFENNGHSINDDRIICMSSSDDWSAGVLQASIYTCKLTPQLVHETHRVAR